MVTYNKLQALVVVVMLSLLGIAEASGAQEAIEKDGDIYYRLAGGEMKRVTFTANNFEPMTSPDGKRICFIREVEKEVPTPDSVLPASDKTQLWLVEIDNKPSEQLLLNCPLNVKRVPYYSFHNLRWAPDGKSIYFLIDYSVVTPAIMRVDISDKRVVFVAAALEYEVVNRGVFLGEIIALQRKITDHGPVEQCSLLKPDGSLVKKLGDSKAAFQKFLKAQRKP